MKYTPVTWKEVSRMGTAIRAATLVVSGLCILSMMVGMGATPSSAAETRGLDQVAIEDLHLALEDLKKVDPDSVEGDVSEEALTEEYSRGGLVTFGKPNGCCTPKSLKKAAKKWNKVFKSVCNSHDKCYSKNSTKDRKTCDKDFRSSMYNVCGFRKDIKTCKAIANVYYAGVRAGGWRTYEAKGKNN